MLIKVTGSQRIEREKEMPPLSAFCFLSFFSFFFLYRRCHLLHWALALLVALWLIWTPLSILQEVLGMKKSSEVLGMENFDKVPSLAVAKCLIMFDGRRIWPIIFGSGDEQGFMSFVLRCSSMKGRGMPTVEKRVNEICSALLMVALIAARLWKGTVMRCLVKGDRRGKRWWRVEVRVE